MTFIAACMQCIYCCMHAWMETRAVSHITVGFYTKPTVIGLHHCGFHYKTGSDGHHQCRFCFKTSSDVSTPYKKEPSRTYTHMHAPSLHFYFSVLRTLTSHSFHSTWSWFLDISLQVYICSPLSHCSNVYMHRRSIFI